MKWVDEEWTDMLVMAATGASTTLGDSTLTTQAALDITTASHVKLKVSGLTLAGGITLRVYWLIGDAASTPVYGYDCDLGGTEYYIPIDGVTDGANTLPSIPVDGRNLKLDVTVSSADATAACTIQALRVYEGNVNA